tara:strand:- start:19968 stop:20720 length:753 start_codon:yes stop_codon:yes gene_type:complete
MRQTELGEFHQDFPSSMGPVSEYHGTVDMPAVMEEGIRGGPTTGRSKRYIPKPLRGEEKISYTSPDRELALRFAQERAKKLGLPQSSVGVVGVRAGGLSEPVRQAEPAGGVFAGTESNVRAGGIPRQNLVPLTLKSETCDCCTPMQQASMALLDSVFEKGKKKSKPFHGYNPKRHHRKGGLNAAGRAKFKRETGANLKPPVTTKPSKLKPGSKRAKRRKSFCARMSGSKGPTSKDGKLTPKGAALKRWNC